jgi:hypothetical protein
MGTAAEIRGLPSVELQKVAEHAQPHLVPFVRGTRGEETRRAHVAPLEHALEEPRHRRLGDGGRQVLFGDRELILLPQPSDLAHGRLHDVDVGALERRTAVHCAIEHHERCATIAAAQGVEIVRGLDGRHAGTSTRRPASSASMRCERSRKRRSSTGWSSPGTVR